MRRLAAFALVALLAPLPVRAGENIDPPDVYRSAVTITPGTNVPYGDGVGMACSAAGTVRLIMQDGTFLDVFATVGTAILDNMAIKGVDPGATTATCTVSVLRSKLFR